MKNRFLRTLRRLGRTVLLLLLVALGTIGLTRFGPGYFTDEREIDPRHASAGRAELAVEQRDHGTVTAIALHTFGGWLHGSFGQSRQYGVPVMELVSPRLAVTGLLLTRAIVCGWLLAFGVALLCSLARRWQTLLGAPFTLLLAVPVGAMGTICLLANKGGPALVLTVLLAARDFKFASRLFHVGWNAPHMLQARAQGLGTTQMIWAHLLPGLSAQLLSLATLSIVTALSAVVPVEVIFDLPGVGQLAWSAAMNRDLPVLSTVTLLLATSVTCANMVSDHVQSVEAL